MIRIALLTASWSGPGQQAEKLLARFLLSPARLARYCDMVKVEVDEPEMAPVLKSLLAADHIYILEIR